jgi:hypothetical protein
MHAIIKEEEARRQKYRHQQQHQEMSAKACASEAAQISTWTLYFPISSFFTPPYLIYLGKIFFFFLYTGRQYCYYA